MLPILAVGPDIVRRAVGAHCYASGMGMMQKIMAAFRGEAGVVAAPEVRQEGVPVSAVSTPPSEVMSEPLPSTEPQAPPLPEERAEPEQKAEPRLVGVKKVMLDEAGLSVLDLRKLPSSRFRIVGSAYWVTMVGREKHGDTKYLLVREPKNKWDKSAVAVYGKGRKVGHLSEKKASAYAPILDSVDFDAFTVGGASASVNSSQLWVDLPSVPALRAYVRTVDTSTSNGAV